MYTSHSEALRSVRLSSVYHAYAKYVIMYLSIPGFTPVAYGRLLCTVTVSSQRRPNNNVGVRRTVQDRSHTPPKRPPFGHLSSAFSNVCLALEKP